MWVMLGGVDPPTPLCAVVTRIDNNSCRAMIWRESNE
jgi:hypothetical protein